MTDTATAILNRPAWSPESGGRLRVFARAHRRRLELVAAIALYLGFACYLTWPLVTNLGHSIYGSRGDPYGTISFYRELVNHHQNPFLPGTISQFAAPEGQTIPWARDLASAPGVLLPYLLTLFFGGIAAFGIYTLTGYILTGVITFLFARRLTSNTWAALIAGWAFAFYPYAAINGQVHPDFVQGWVLVLAIWRMLELMWYPTRRNGLLAGLATVLCMWWSPYFILFVGVAYVTVTIATLVIARLNKSLRATLVPQSIAALVIAVFLAFLAILASAGAAESIGVRAHPLGELSMYGAHPLEYLLPDVQSPLFGSATSSYLNSLAPNVGPQEKTLYIGVTVILLALLPLLAYFRRRLEPKIGRAVLVLWLVAAVSVIASMPPEPHIFGVQIPFPSRFIWLVTQSWRVYERFVIVVMLALSALMAVGLNLLIRGRAWPTKIAIMSLATLLIALDLWTPPGGHVNKISTPTIYRTLARQPPGLVAEYPLGAARFSTYGDQLYQSAYNKPMINGYVEGSSQELRAFSLSSLANPATAPRLATLGVRYVLVDSSPPPLNWGPAGKPGAGLRLIAQEPYADLYVVTASPSSSALATTGNGFIVAGITSTGTLTALDQTSGEIELQGPCKICSGELSMTLSSYGGQAREVVISDSQGHTLRDLTVTEGTKVTIPIRFSEHTTLSVTATPGPQPISEAPESPSVSLLVVGSEFIDTSDPRSRSSTVAG